VSAIVTVFKKLWEKLKAPRRRALPLQIEDLLRRVGALPTLDPRSADEILRYNEHGLPS
jgi:hypothetical protein